MGFKKFLSFSIGLMFCYFAFISGKEKEILKYIKGESRGQSVIVRDEENPFYNGKLTREEKKCLKMLQNHKQQIPLNTKEEIQQFRQKINRLKLRARAFYDNLSDDAKEVLIEEQEIIQKLPKDVQKIVKEELDH